MMAVTRLLVAEQWSGRLDEIVARQDQRNRLELYRGRQGVAGFVQRALKLLAKTELPERSRHPQRARISPSLSRRFDSFAAPKMRSTRSSVPR